jgi:hypothetical protein
LQALTAREDTERMSERVKGWLWIVGIPVFLWGALTIGSGDAPETTGPAFPADCVETYGLSGMTCE